jgi:hypothetical protein
MVAIAVPSKTSVEERREQNQSPWELSRGNGTPGVVFYWVDAFPALRIRHPKSSIAAEEEKRHERFMMDCYLVEHHPEVFAEYAGGHIAVRGGHVIAHSPSFKELLGMLIGGGEPFVTAYIPAVIERRQEWREPEYALAAAC